jgi:hypothetical protein
MYKTEDVTIVKGVVRIMENKYWWCINGKPEQAVFYVGKYGKYYSPQCNSDESVMLRLPKPDLDNLELVLIPNAFVKHIEQ